VEKMTRLGAYSGVVKEEEFIPRIKPFIFLGEKETMLYSMLNGIDAIHTPCPYAGYGFRGLVSRSIKEFETKYSGSKRNVVNTMLNVKESRKNLKVKNVNKCIQCGFPSVKEICEACKIKISLQKAY
jgi:uncharacterized protein (TIGR00269 family)